MIVLLGEENMGVSDTAEKDWEEHYKEYAIPKSLLNILADINVNEINSHLYTMDEFGNVNANLESWLCSWHEKIKQELYDFVNKPSGCRYYIDNHCECRSRENELSEEILKLNEEIKLLQSDKQSLKNMIVKMCYERFGE